MEQPKPTLDQRRAAHAWKTVAEAKKLPEGLKKSFAAEAKKLPARILSAGLAGSLAFLTAKEPKLLTARLSDWILKERKLDGAAEQDLLARIVKGDSLYLRRATDEALAYLQWLVRLAEAEGLANDDKAA
jgi:CRISPR-associated protein Cmr5